MAKGSLRVNGIIVDADGELKASTGKSIVIREDDGSAVISVDTSGNVLIGGPTTVGVDDSGHDVKFFGATSGSYMLWDESADSLIVDGKIGIGTTAPSEKLQVNGNIKISDGGTIGSATTAGAITIAANGALTLSTAPAGFNYVATVTAAQTNSTDGIVIENSGTAAAGVTVAHADTTTQTSVNNSGRTYIQDITLDTYGHITEITSATETVTDTTYSVATNAALGLVQIGYTESGKNYPVELGSGTNANKMFVNVPWTDTTYSVASGTALGLVQIGYTESGKNYPVELSSNKMYVNVPWTDTNTTYSVADSSTLGLIKIGYSQTGKNYPVQLSSEQAYVNVPWTDTDTNTTYSAGTGLGLSGTTFNLDDAYGKIIEMHKFDVDPTAVSGTSSGAKACHTTRAVSFVSGRSYHIQFTFDYRIYASTTAAGSSSHETNALFYLYAYTGSSTKGQSAPPISPLHRSNVTYRSNSPQGEQWGTKTLSFFYYAYQQGAGTRYPLLAVGTTSCSTGYGGIDVAPYLDCQSSNTKTPIYLTIVEYEGVQWTSSTT